MEFNAEHDTIGKRFAEQYYSLFDDPDLRADVIKFYSTSNALMSFEGHQIQGAAKILEKVQNLSLPQIKRSIISVDAKCTFDKGLLITVIGRLQWNEDVPRGFSHNFVLKSNGNGIYYITHDIFQINSHNSGRKRARN